MSQYFQIYATGLRAIDEYGAALKNGVERAALRSINRTAERARTLAARQIREELNLPAAYLQPGGKRLFVSQRATGKNLEARVMARSRPTSLARFATSTKKPFEPGVTVQVQPGKARYLKKAFFIKLRAGTASIDTRSNLGLAVRLKPGETIRNKKRAVQLSKNLFLLYGPSVAQAFISSSGRGVAGEIVDDVLDFLETEFTRQMDL